MSILETQQDLTQQDAFIHRHIGPSPKEIQLMLTQLGVSSLDELIETTVPSSIVLDEQLDLPEPQPEHLALRRLREYADQNKVFKSYIGMGYYDTHVPNVILRNVLENPGWYTAYTPYQAEISQGRLESLLNFQQMVMDLTGMEMANASLLDEATAAAEAMALAKRASKNPSNRFFIVDDVHPQTLDVVVTRAKYFGFEIITGSMDDLPEDDIFGALVQYPGSSGRVVDIENFIERVHKGKALVAVAEYLKSNDAKNYTVTLLLGTAP